MKLIEVMCGDLLNIDLLKTVCIRRDTDDRSRFKSYVIENLGQPFEFIELLPSINVFGQEIKLEEVHYVKLLMYAMNFVISTTYWTISNECITRNAYTSLGENLRTAQGRDGSNYVIV